MTIGEKIKAQRELIGLSQDELAKKMGYKDRSSISKIEKGSDKNLPLEVVQKFAEVLKCSPLVLMGCEEKESTPSDDEMVSHYKKYSEFIDLYSQLSDEKRTLVDNMLRALSEKQ